MHVPFGKHGAPLPRARTRDHGAQDLHASALRASRALIGCTAPAAPVRVVDVGQGAGFTRTPSFTRSPG